jgi:hypothetical protein
MGIRIQEAAPLEAEIVSEVLAEAALRLRESGMALWAPEEVSASRVAPEVQAGLYFLAWSGPAAVGTMRLTTQ